MTETYRIRSVQTWVQARDDYLGGMSAEAVCHRHDLGLSAFRRRARKYGWRRMDQADPAPAELDLTIYADVDDDEEVQLARLRYLQALNHGRSIDAARWRRLWMQMRDDLEDAALFRACDPARKAARPPRRPLDEDSPEDARLLAALPLLSAEKVHDVHHVFSNAPPAAEPNV